MDEYARYAWLYDPLVGPFLKPIHRAMLAALAVRQSGKVLDLCCGTGTLAGMVADRGVKSVGIDLSAAMLHIAREKHPAVTFIDGDAASLFFSDDEFDAVTVSFALHEKRQSVAMSIVSEAFRVVRSGGVVIVADYRWPPPGESRLTGFGINAVERLAGREHHACFRAFMDAGGTESFLAGLGLPGQPVMTFMGGWVGLYIIIK